ncbi:MAG TPA: hypothetical protein VMT62_02060 [Syntrophorhabdaceae bacterium]|nr:hypothetical protein [Syntrophorhabdaceae bacterium]
MRYVVVGALALFIFCLCTGVYGQQQVNFICKNDCLSKSKTIGECNALCSTTDEAGNPTKDVGCIDSCTGKGGSYYNCYSACGASDNGAGGTQEVPAPPSNMGEQPRT